MLLLGQDRRLWRSPSVLQAGTVLSTVQRKNMWAHAQSTVAVGVVQINEYGYEISNKINKFFNK